MTIRRAIPTDRDGLFNTWLRSVRTTHTFLSETPGRFSVACGFVVEGRSELDSTGRPFPLLHMRLAAKS